MFLRVYFAFCQKYQIILISYLLCHFRRPPKVEKRLISELIGAGDNLDTVAARPGLERDVSEIQKPKPKPLSESFPQQSDKIPSVESANDIATGNVDKVPVNCIASSNLEELPAVTTEAPGIVEVNANPEEEPSLPDSLPPELCSVIDELKLVS